VNNNQYSPKSIHAQRHQPIFAYGVRILDGDGVAVAKRLFCVREANPMLLKVRDRFLGIELNLHAANMYCMHIPVKCRAPRDIQRVWPKEVSR